MRSCCATCRHYEARDAAMPWPVAGVPREAQGRCGAPSIDPARPRWRRETDRCGMHAPAPTGPADPVSAAGPGRRSATARALRRHFASLTAWPGWPYVGDALGALALLALFWGLFILAGVLS